LLIGPEDGTRSIHNVKGVKFVKLYKSSEIGDLADHLRRGDYKSVVLDTASMLQHLILKEVLGLKTIPVQFSWGFASREEWGVVALQTKERLAQLLDLPMHVVIVAQERAFNTGEDAETSEVLLPYVASALSPSIVGWLNPACDYIGQMYKRRKTRQKVVGHGAKKRTIEVRTNEIEYVMRAAPDDVYTTKFRAPKGLKVPSVIVDPTFEKIQAITEKGLA
jgi:hypothetical protein